MKYDEGKHNSAEGKNNEYTTSKGQMTRHEEEGIEFNEFGEYTEFDQDYVDDFDDFDGIDDIDEEYYEFYERKKFTFIKRSLAIILITSFLLLSIPSLFYLLSDKYDFLDQNRNLIKDDIVKQSRPAVVSVETRLKTGAADVILKYGTGFNISPEGKIITNKHVVEDAELITVHFGGGKSYLTRDFEVMSGADIAIVDIDGENLPVLDINRDTHVSVGDMVTVIGNPLGYKKIAQRGEVVKFYQMKDSATSIFEFDININQGNSGSPVINDQGEVVGVVFATLTHENEGIEVKRGLAIPVSELPSSIFEI
ncbi:MAG TPA: serine protease [Clostridiales bacterium]|nr:serine protease [Clostridiales bacterium]